MTEFMDRLNAMPQEKRLYTLKTLPSHLTHTKQLERLRQLLTTFDFLQAKVNILGPQSLIADYSETNHHEFRLIQGALQLSAHILVKDLTQLAPQLLGRLMFHKTPSIQSLLGQARLEKTIPWLRPLIPSLTSPGGPLTRTLTGHTQPINAVTITPDGRRIISCAEDGMLKVWDLVTGECLQTLEGHWNPYVMSVAVTPDGTSAISVSLGGDVKIWDIEHGIELQTLTGYEGGLKAVSITPDGRRALFAAGHPALQIWDLRAGKELYDLSSRTGGVTAIAITPDSKWAVSSSRDRTLSVWNLESGIERFVLVGHTDWVNGVVVSPNGHYAVSASNDSTLKLWSLESGAELQTFRGHTSNVNSVVITPDGQTAVSASSDNTLKVWSLTTGKCLHTLTGHTAAVNTLTITPDGQQIISGAEDYSLKIWNVGDFSETSHMPEHTPGFGRGIAITSDGQRLVFGSRNGIKVWLLESAREIGSMTGHQVNVRAVTVTPDGRYAISGSADKTLKVWDLKTGDCLKTLTGHTSWVNAVQVTPDGQHVLSGAETGDCSIKLWNTDSGEECYTLAGHQERILALAVTSDGRQAVSGSSDKTLRIWDLEQAKELATLKGHRDWVNAVVIASDGRRVISGAGGYDNRYGSIDNSLKVWDLQSGMELSTLKGHTDGVMGLALTPDGRFVVSASKDHTLKVWSLELNQAIASFSGDGELFDCAVAPDGVTIVVGGSSAIHILRLEGIEGFSSHPVKAMASAMATIARQPVQYPYRQRTRSQPNPLEGLFSIAGVTNHVMELGNILLNPQWPRAERESAAIKLGQIGSYVAESFLTTYLKRADQENTEEEYPISLVVAKALEKIGTPQSQAIARAWREKANSLPSKSATDETYSSTSTFQNHLGMVCFQRKQYMQAIDYFQKALTLARDNNDKTMEAKCLSDIGMSCHFLKEDEQAINYFRQALVLAQNLGDRHNEAGCLVNLGAAYFALGQNAAGEDCYRRAMIMFERLEDKLMVERLENKMSFRNNEPENALLLRCRKCGAGIHVFRGGLRSISKYRLPQDVLVCENCFSIYKADITPNGVRLGADVTDKYPKFKPQSDDIQSGKKWWQFWK